MIFLLLRSISLKQLAFTALCNLLGSITCNLHDSGSKVPRILPHATLVTEAFIHAVAQILPLLPPPCRCKYLLESVAKSKDITAPPCLVPFLCCRHHTIANSFWYLSAVWRTSLHSGCCCLYFVANRHFTSFLFSHSFPSCCIPDTNHGLKKKHFILYQGFFFCYFLKILLTSLPFSNATNRDFSSRPKETTVYF